MPSSEPPSKRKRIEISTEKKQQICQYQRDHKKATQNEIRQHFNLKWGINVGRSTISDILKQKGKWLSSDDIKRKSLTRARHCKEPELESAIFLWFTDVRSRNLPVTCDMLKEKAKTFGEQLGVKDFAYSNGWLNRFKKRHAIALQKVRGESAAADVVEVSNGGENLQQIIANYALQNVYNNPPTQRDSESESDHDETESPPRAVTTNEAISAISTLIYYFEQHSSLPKVTNYLDSAWAMKRNIQSFSKDSLVQREITDFFK
ncbi:unnamed protein product [Clavelina lepadiformis]|uniref:HTH CENPB-type domain-containing protein n=1 Tax=Clavelina lepadiformis TaxID=159417 RepID=A0ABP0GR55_CLALP